MTSISRFWFSTSLANLLKDDLADELRFELLVEKRIPESNVTFTACNPLLSVTCSTCAPSTCLACSAALSIFFPIRAPAVVPTAAPTAAPIAAPLPFPKIAPNPAPTAAPLPPPIRAPFPVFDMLQLVNSMPAANIQDIILMLFIFLVLEIDLQK